MGKTLADLHPSASRVVSATLLVLIALSFTGCRRREKSDTPKITAGSVSVRMGMGPAADTRGRSLLRAVIINEGAHFNGELNVTGLVEPDIPSDRLVRESAGYRMQLQLPPKSRRLVEVPVRAANWSEVSLAFRQDDYAVSVDAAFAIEEPAYLRALVIGEKPPEMRPFIDAVRASFDRPAGGEEGDDRATCRLDYARADELSYRMSAYTSYQMVILWGEKLSRVEPGAFEALETWVRGGGTLVAVPATDWDVELPERLQSLLHITPASPTATTQKLRRIVDAASVPCIARDLTPREGASRDEARGTVTARVGNGRVTTLAIAPTGSRFPTAVELPVVHEALMPAVARAVSFAGDSETALAAIEERVAGVLTSMTDFEVPSVGSAALGMLAYALVGFLLPRIVFRGRRGREWTFVVIAAVAVVAVVGIGFFGLVAGLDGPEIEELSVLRLAAGETEASTTSYLCVISPRWTRFDPAPSPDGAAAEPRHTETLRGFQASRMGEPAKRLPGPSDAVRVPSGSDVASLPPVRLFPNGPRFFRCDYRRDVSDLLSLRETPADATIENRSARPMEVFLVAAGGVRKLGTIDRETTRTLAFDPAGLVSRTADKVTRSPRSENEIQAAAPRGGFDPHGMKGLVSRTADRVTRSAWSENEIQAAAARGGFDPDGMNPARSLLFFPLAHETELFFLCLWSVMRPDDDGAAAGWARQPWWPASEEPIQLTIPGGDLRTKAPRFLLLWSSSPVFPDANGFRRRRASTAIVVELASRERTPQDG